MALTTGDKKRYGARSMIVNPQFPIGAPNATLFGVALTMKRKPTIRIPIQAKANQKTQEIQITIKPQCDPPKDSLPDIWPLRSIFQTCSERSV